jgi:transposase InsO family protein
VSVATCYKWLRRYRAEGLAGLVDRSCRPQRSPRRLPPEREQAILAWRQSHRVGPHRIGWALGEARSTVSAVLARHQLPRLAELDRPSGQVVRYQRQRPGELVHVDIKAQGRIPNGGGHRLLGRRSAGRDCGRLHRPSAGLVRPAGVPVERVLTDNGWCYRSAAFQQVLAEAGAAHRRTRPYRPQTNGKAERFNRTWPLSGPMAGCTPATRPVWRPYLAGCTTTTATAPIPPWTEGAPCNSSTTSLGTTARAHRSRRREPARAAGPTCRHARR